MLHERRAEERVGVRFAFALVVLGLLMLSAVLLLPGAEAVTTLNSTRVTTTDILASGRTSLGGVAATTNDALHVEGSSLFNGTVWANASFGQANFLRVGNWSSGYTYNFTNATATAYRTVTFPDTSGTVALADVAGNIAWASVDKTGSSLADLATRAIGDTTGTLATTRGGTGLTSYAQGDLPYASAADTLWSLAIGTSGKVLSSTGSAPAWSTIESLGGVTGTGSTNRVAYWTDVDTIASDADLTFDGTTTTMSALALNGAGTLASGTVLTWGGDTNIKRETANLLATDDDFAAHGTLAAAYTTAGQVLVGSSSIDSQILFGSASDVRLWRPTANELKVDDRFTVGATSALVLEPTSSATLPAAVEGALVYDTTNDVFKGGISGAPSYQTLGALATANTWTATQTYTGIIQAGSQSGSVAGAVLTARRDGVASAGTPTIFIGNAASVGEYALAGFGYTGGGTISNAPTSIGYIATSGIDKTKGDLVFNTRDVTTDTAPTERLRITSAGDITVADTGDFIFSATTGTKFGTATTQKMGWWNAAPVARSTWTLTSNDLTDNTGGTVSDTTMVAITGNALCTGGTCADAANTRSNFATTAAKLDELTADVAALQTILSTYGMVG